MVFSYTKARYVAAIAGCLFAIVSAGCGGSGGGAAGSGIGGKVGDGAVTNGLGTFRNSSGVVIKTNVAIGADSTYSVTLPSGTAYPVTFTVDSGTDSVTNAAIVPGSLVSLVVSASQTTGNVSPLTTLMTQIAINAAGGLANVTATQIATAEGQVISSLGMGASSVTAGLSLLSSPISSFSATDVSLLIKASEAVGELMNRTVAGSTAAGTTLATVISALASDIGGDGKLDGFNGATALTGTALTIAGDAIAAKANVAAELAAGSLRVGATDLAGTTGGALKTPAQLATASAAAIPAAVLAAVNAGITAAGATAITAQATSALIVLNVANGNAGLTGAPNMGANAAAVKTSATTQSTFKLAANTAAVTDYNASNVAQVAFNTAGGVIATGALGGVNLGTPLIAANLTNLASATPTGTSPKIAFTLARLPVGSGTSTVTALLKDVSAGNAGTPATLVAGTERQLSVVFDVNWTSDGTTLSLNAAAGDATATYYTAAGTVAVTATLSNATANNVLSTGTAVSGPFGGNTIINAAITNLFSSTGLGTALTAVTTVGSYYYEIGFTNFPILDSASNAGAGTAFTSVNGTFSASATDTTAPVLQSFTSTTTDGSYKAGSTVNITATYSENLAAGSTVTVVLDTNASVTLNTVSGNTLTGTYTVGVGQTSADLTVNSITSQSVSDAATNTLSTTTLPATNIAAGSALVIDTATPALQSFTSTTTDGSYKAGGTINITATYSENLAAGSTVTVVLDTTASVTLNTISGSTLTGTYTVGANQTSADLTVSSITSQSVSDAATNTLSTTTLPATNIAAGSALVIDTTVPAVPAITSHAANAAVTTNTPTVSGTAEAGAAIILYSGIGSLTQVGTATATGGNWSLTSGALVNGAHTLSATATDAAGNVSAASQSVLITVNGNPAITGAVVDGRVNGATLTLFSDQAMMTQVGSGTTDTSGNFNLQLTVATAPDPIYIKSVGGTDIDTGMPAPTMRFVGNTTGANALTSFNITPLTDDVFDHVDDGDTLLAAQGKSRTAFGLASNTGANGLYEDHTAAGNTNLKAAAFKKLTAGTTGGTIGAGSYKMFAITVDETDVAAPATAIANIAALTNPANGNFVDANMTVAANGDISGSSGGQFFRGKIVGSSMMFNIVDNVTTPTSVTRVVGNIGLNGSVSGNFTDVTGIGTTNTMTKGLFVGSLIPATGVNVNGLGTFLADFYTPDAAGTATTGTGLMNVVARDIFSGGVPQVRWGRTGVKTVNVPAGTVTMSDMPLRVDAGSAAGAITTFTFASGAYVKNVASIPTNLLVFQYAIPGGGNLYVATAVGLRRGIYFVTGALNAVIAVGESYMSKVNSVAPNGFVAGATHDVTVADINPGMPGNSRTLALAAGLKPTAVPGGLPIPALGGSLTSISNGYVTAPELMIFQGSMFVMKQDANNNFLDNQLSGGGTDDHLRVVEFFESGAMQGEEILGGTVDPDGPGPGPAITLRNFPMNFVGFVQDQAITTTPSYSGTLNFLARTIYASSFAGFANAFTSGTIAITAPTTTAGSATLVATDGGATTSTTHTLAVDVTATGAPGVYHMHGALTGGGYIDISWPIGGTKALYAISASATGTVQEVGEAYITQ